MDGYKIQLWNRCQELASDLGIDLSTKGDALVMVAKKTGAMLGKVETIELVASYLYGVEYGRNLKQGNENG